MTETNDARSFRCRVCDAAIAPFMSFGRMPIANGFLKPEEASKEYFFELAPAFCGTCGMFQLLEQPRPEKMFHEQYAFYSSTSRYMQAHFEAFAHDVMNGVLAGRNDPFVVELGSNDGIMLGHFRKRGLRHLGVEPSTNVAEVARKQGIATISAFFDRKLGDEIAAGHGGADAILAANVIHSRSARSGSGRAAPAQTGRRLHFRRPLSR
jgi:methylation protein EvaC